MDQSILETIRQLVGPGLDHTFFDTEYIIHINTAIGRLRQLGIGPATGFRITGTSETWRALIGDSNLLDGVITYVALSVKKKFDPSASSTIKAALDEELAELTWTLIAAAEDEPKLLEGG